MLVFGDATNGDTTYGHGRFLTIDSPSKYGATIMDFNYAKCPPCIFTEYATCPRPLQQNQFPVEVKAGEQRSGY